ncbi:helix-turn-helix domain-containing protein [Spirosoma oryzicola]|uniref:helix-turn-helix domain-containing protein n=1 Tax=Spirosoma oryzicola TaxID=2898794 RepID=UPI001E34EC84|nr:helix-turn-helix transcriptional regulator [Spirosoma oryzicola]UHG93263.1 helix-turn-helix domain-containing protein [Spirosoma oryzicola]
MSEITEQVGNQIREARKRRGLTLKELGEKVGVSESVMSRYEKGKINFTVDSLQKISSELGTKLNINLSTD